MVIDDCSVTTVIEGISYCIVVLHQQSWMDELNNMDKTKVVALLSATFLIWYVATGLRTVIQTLGSDTNED